MKLIKFVFVAFLFSLLTGGSCNKPTPVTPPTPVVDAGPPPEIDAGVDSCTKFCSHMTDVNCAPDPKCLKTCRDVLQANLIRLPIDCVLVAPTKTAVIKCGATCK